MASTILASTVASLDANVIKVAVPAIGRDLGSSVASLQWTVTSYLVTVAALLLLAGGLADRFGRRRILMIGLFVMLVSSVLCAGAPTVGALIAARVVQGIGGGLVIPTSLALLSGGLQVSDRARAIGIWAGIETLGTTVGPYVGGWLVDDASWRAVFLLSVPLVLAGLVTLRWVPTTHSVRRRLSLDVPGGLLAVVGLGAVVYALTAGSQDGWYSAPVAIAAAVGVGALAVLTPVERRVRAPMLRLSLFASRQFDAINVTTILLYGALSAASYLVILQCELRLGYSAAQAGAALIPESLVFLVLAPVSGVLVARVGPRRLMVAGILCVAAALFWLSGAHSGESYVGAILPPALLWGIGIGVCVTPLTAAVLASASDDSLGEASGVNDAASRIGGVVAVALVPALIGAAGGRSLAHALVNGYKPAMVVMGAVCLGAALVAGAFVVDHATTEQATPKPSFDQGDTAPEGRHTSTGSVRR